jgi:hypothetical protein
MVYNLTMVQQSGKGSADLNGEEFEGNLLNVTVMVHC